MYKPKVWHGLTVPQAHKTMSVIESVKFHQRDKRTTDYGDGEVLAEQLVGPHPSRMYYLVRFPTDTFWVQSDDVRFMRTKKRRTG
jgi:hypothetical protein